MTKKRNRRLIGILALLVASATVLNVLAYSHARGMMQFTSNGKSIDKPEDLSFWKRVQVLLLGINVSRPNQERLPSDLAPGCDNLPINSPDNITLATWYCYQGKDTPLVILFHGYAADKTSLLREAKMFMDLGHSVMLVDFRGSGGSSESYTTIGIREGDDVAAVVRYARAYLSPAHTTTILFGRSMGAVAILRAVHEHSIVPDAIILEAVFDTMLNTVRNRFAALGVPSFPSAELLVFWGGWHANFCGFSHNPIDYAKSVFSPALFMHGAGDSRATITEGRRVFEAVPGPKDFLEFEAVGHEAYASKYPHEWQSAVAEIISKAQHEKTYRGRVLPPVI